MDVYTVALVKVLNTETQSASFHIPIVSQAFFSTRTSFVKDYDRLADFDVMGASDVIDPTQSSDKQLCAHVGGPVARGGWMEIYCNPPISGR